MDKLAIGFWGCYFGTTVLMLAGAALAFLRSLHRIAVNAALAASVSAFFVVAFLNALPIADVGVLSRFLAHLTVFVSGVLFYLLFAMLGLLRSSIARWRVRLALAAACAAVMGAGWLLAPRQSLALALGMAGLLGLLSLLSCIRSALRGDRLARPAIAGVLFMLLGLGGLGWIALDRQGVPWQVHAASAIATTLYLVIMAAVLWSRYAYLIELHEVMSYGPSYDPITRMRLHPETGQTVAEVLAGIRDEHAPVGLVVVSIANFYALDKLHGQAAVNHALFVCAGRLRRSIPKSIEMGRLGPDGFVFIMRQCNDSGRLIDLARLVLLRLGKPLSLNTSGDISRLETENTIWAAELGLGVLRMPNPTVRSASAIALARGLSRAAVSYVSRIAWFDHSSGEMAELPVLQPD